MVDMTKIRRESMRWRLLDTLNKARPHTSSAHWLLEVMRGVYADATALEIQRELDYLHDRDLVELVKQPSGMWFADLSRYGVDIAEYTIDCEPGIARPPIYWNE
jgi:hypothetical protein